MNLIKKSYAILCSIFMISICDINIEAQTKDSQLRSVIFRTLEKSIAQINNLNNIILFLSQPVSPDPKVYRLMHDQITINYIIKLLQKKYPADRLLYALILSNVPGMKNWLKNKMKTDDITKEELQENLIFITKTPNYLQNTLSHLTRWEFSQTPAITISALKTIIQLGIDPNIKNSKGNTPLIYAVLSNQIPIVQFLLSLPQIDTTIRNAQGQTALDIAQKTNNTQIINMLKNHTSKK
ncbi:MAG: ankyrin repeat domain-containing protein [Candidatus Babeliales bacterium]